MLVYNELFQIETPSGWSDFDGIQITIKNNYVHIICENNMNITCSENHKVLSKGNFIFAKDLKLGDEIDTSEGPSEIKSISFISDNDKLFYEPLNVKNENQYLSNGIISHNCDFIGSSNTLIPGRYIRQFVPDDPVKYSKQLSVYKEPIQGHTYLIVADPSRGTGNDNSAFILFDITNYPIQICATFRDPNASPIVFPSILEKIALSYNNAYILVETNDNGQQVADILWRDFEYENLIVFGFHNSDKLGVRTTRTVKTLGCSNFKDMVENDKILINDTNLISEISTFIQKKTSYEADIGCTDDLVMCCVLLGWYSTTQDFKHLTDVDLRAEIQAKKQQEIEEDIIPFGFIVGGFEIGFEDIIVDKQGDIWFFDDEWKI